MFEECFGEGPFLFRINETGSGPNLLIQVCLERGWKEYNSDYGDQWNLWWRTSGLPVKINNRNLYAWQYVNHIPNASSICRKDNLIRYLRCMKKVYGAIYDFSPVGYNLPLEYTKLAVECTRGKIFSLKNNQHERMYEKPIWICKPVGQSQGKGIFLFKKLSELSYDSNTIVQRYIEKPLLIGGYKFDLRLYVCIPSYYPVTIYMYKEGLARFGTDKFSLNDLRNPFRHLTNCSINKFGPGYAEMKDQVGSGCKWTLRQLRRYFQEADIFDWLLWQRISSLVTLTVISHISQITPTVNCFEFHGFDVLIDVSLRPWLLEVNVSPALSNDCDADRFVKKPMLHDMFDLLGLPLYNTGLSVFDVCQDDNKYECEKRTSYLLNNTLSIMKAAKKWQRRHRRISARETISRATSATRDKSRMGSSNGNLPKLEKNHTNFYSLPKTRITFPRNQRNLNEEYKRVEIVKNKWGNGRDWNMAPEKEGGWIRIWPITDKNRNKDIPNVKYMVTQIIKFSKVAKEIAKKHPTASDFELNNYLLREMKVTGEVWMPPI